MFSALERICLALRFICSTVAVILFTVMLIAVLAQVAGRYFFNFSIAQAAEIATYSQIWMVLLGGGVALARGQHVAIEAIPAALPLPLARLALIAIAVISGTFLFILAKGSLPLLKMGMMQTSPAMRMPMVYIYACLPVGAGYMILELLLSVIRRWNDPFPPPEVDEPSAVMEAK